MRAWVVLLGISLLSVAFVGCLSSDDTEDINTNQVLKPGQKIADDQSAIKGTVTDVAVQPIEGANLTLLELGITVTTRADGFFSIGPIAPGSYTLAVRAPGHISAQQAVEAPAGETASVDFLLTKLVSRDAFMQQFEIAGFFEYGWGTGWNLTSIAGETPGGLFWVRDSNCDYDAIAGPNCRGEVELEPPLDSIVFEMIWDAGTPLAQELMAMMRVSDNASIITGEWEFFSVEGPSPLYHRMDRQDIDAVMANFTQRCEDGEDAFCGLNFRDRGWPLQTRVWPGWRCPTDTTGFCAILQQEYTQILSAFYNAPAPEGFSVIEGVDGS